MAQPHPAVAATRAAISRVELRRSGDSAVGDRALDHDAPVVLVACSGGPRLAGPGRRGCLRGIEARLAGRSHHYRIMIFSLAPLEVADRVATWGRGQGFDPVVVEKVCVIGHPGGPEASARTARYQALIQAADRIGAGWVLLGHTLHDQAETVLLSMLRGAGLRGLAGMPTMRDIGGGACLVRPFLEISRDQTESACAALGLTPWLDPHNGDPTYARTRARAHLATLARDLGPGVVANLARTASQVAAAAEAIDELARSALDQLIEPGTGQSSDRSADRQTVAGGSSAGLRAAGLVRLPAAVRARVLHRWARSLGVSGSALSQRHLRAMEALVVGWRGQGPVYLPGAITVVRRDGVLWPGFDPADQVRLLLGSFPHSSRCPGCSESRSMRRGAW